MSSAPSPARRGSSQEAKQQDSILASCGDGFNKGQGSALFPEPEGKSNRTFKSLDGKTTLNVVFIDNSNQTIRRAARHCNFSLASCIRRIPGSSPAVIHPGFRVPYRTAPNC